jgi:hypothetical protein
MFLIRLKLCFAGFEKGFYRFGLWEVKMLWVRVMGVTLVVRIGQHTGDALSSVFPYYFDARTTATIHFRAPVPRSPCTKDIIRRDV